MQLHWLEKILSFVSFCYDSQKECPESIPSVEILHRSAVYSQSFTHLRYTVVPGTKVSIGYTQKKDIVFMLKGGVL